MTSTREARGLPADAGISLIEIIVAIMIFALVSVGIITGTATVTRMTADNRSREVATNLAEQQLDSVRETIDPFQVPSTFTSSVTISGRVYTTTQTSSWQSQSGSDISCGSNANLYFKRVNVTVTWSGQLGTTQPVRSDTILAPNGRINDSSTGSIAATVIGAAGSGEPGVTITVTPNSGGTGAPLQTQPALTDGDGCSYALGVTPGTYTVTATETGGVGIDQSTSAKNTTVVVTAGTTYSVPLTLDQATTYNVNYASNVTATPAPALPTNLDTTFVPVGSAGAPWPTSVPTSVISLFPFPAGYTAIAGAEANTNGNTLCASEDPAAWAAGSVSGTALQAGTRAPAAPGTIGVSMGTVTVKATAAAYYTVVSATATGTGNPGCSTAAGSTSYTFGTVTPKSGSVVLALPYGSWRIYQGVFGNLLQLPLTSSSITATSNVVASSAISTSGGFTTVTLDPRTAK